MSSKNNGGAQIATALIGLGAVAVAGGMFFLKQQEKAQQKVEKKKIVENEEAPKKEKESVLILHASYTGTAKRWAEYLHTLLTAKYEDKETIVTLGSCKNYDVEDITKFTTVYFLSSTNQGGTIPEEGRIFYDQLLECQHDFRFGRYFLSDQTIACIGFGDPAYGDKLFCRPIRKSLLAFRKLGGSCRKLELDTAQLSDGEVKIKMLNLIETIEKAVERKAIQGNNKNTEFDTESNASSNNNMRMRKAPSRPLNVIQNELKKVDEENSGDEQIEYSNSPEGVMGENSKTSNTTEQPESDEDDETEYDSDDFDIDGNLIMMEDVDAENADIEGVGCCGSSSSSATGATNTNSPTSAAGGNNNKVIKLKSGKKVVKDSNSGLKKMLSVKQRANLTKEGYKVVGEHSAVKLCRWTKHHLRGRGGCYKHTFYGIMSLSCMEATPSLACANKCVFCWRHHTNPVAKQWEWQMDEPQMIVDNWLKEHAKMIKTLNGVPGITPERRELAKKIRHCALSLVGEPIMYPRINEILGLLHEKSISTFLVTNAQFPEQLRNIGPCTQLYLSIDASNMEDLKRVDRPLNENFWELFQGSIQALKNVKFNRTVFRLTLVQGYNMDKTHEYSSLIAEGEPDLIEIKGVTFSGDDPTAKEKMTMKNVPFHENVVNFGKEILKFSNLHEDYELACEHEHSLCILLAHKKFKRNGEWHTHINYEKFHELVRSGEWKNKSSEDYCAPTPVYAVYGSKERGFDPEDTRVFRNKKVGGANKKGADEAKAGGA